MKSGPSRVNAPLEGLRFQDPEGTFTASGRGQSRHQADKSQPVERACKGRVGVGRRSAPGMVQCRGTRRLGTVVGVWLVPEGGV